VALGDGPSGSFCMVKDIFDMGYSGDRERSPSQCAIRDLGPQSNLNVENIPGPAGDGPSGYKNAGNAAFR